MKKIILLSGLQLCCLFWFAKQATAQNGTAQIAANTIKQTFLRPPESAKPWVYWYWMWSSVTREAITADLEAMQQQGIGGAYLMTIGKSVDPPYITPPVVPLTPEWWKMVRHAMSEAGRLGIKLAMSDCDGWALAGGPWITPELSMQKVVWTKTAVNGGRVFNESLAQPESYKGYYKDIAVYAYPAQEGSESSTQTIVPEITVSTPEKNAQYLALPNNKKTFHSEENCWIQLKFDQPFTCRSLVIRSKGKDYQAERMTLEISDDGKNFSSAVKLEAPRHGWQNDDAEVTHSIPATTAKYFRFIYNKEGSEPGGEDLDIAKWKPEINILGIDLSSEAKIHQFEGKTGEVWRVSRRSTAQQLPDNLCVPKSGLLNITDKLGADGRLNWKVPPGKWTILRMGHTSTGHQNAKAGSAGGLECDKFNPEAAKIQFENWFGEAVRQNGLEMTKQVLNIFHIDSWECGSQNWSPVFAEEFKNRRGYDLISFLPVMAGVPLESAETSEKVLSDVRQTIAELIVDNFYDPMAKLAKERGCSFSAESVAPTMTSDGMLHFSKVDFPMGEFWLRSPTHDKPNDMLDAISGGHIYGKNIIQAEAFTELKLMWDEHPGMLKAITDRNYALGINRFVLHVNVHNPWTDRKPGMTLFDIGLYFQRDQTWWKPGKAWVDYMQRCQAMLQLGIPVVDVAVFTGEETPRRALLPDRLVSTLPGIFGKDRVQQETKRLANKGVPLRTLPVGIVSTDNSADPEEWLDPLNGYAYDSFNRDALLRLAQSSEGRMKLPGGASYGVLVIPAHHAMSPDSNLMSAEVSAKFTELEKAGIPIIRKPYTESTFDQLNIQRDVILTETSGNHAPDIAWTHRRGDDFDIYFIANQKDEARTIDVSLRDTKYSPELWDPLTTEIRQAGNWKKVKGRILIPLHLEANGSIFIVIKAGNNDPAEGKSNWPTAKTVKAIDNTWKVAFDPAFGGPKNPITFDKLQDWTKNTNDAVKYYSGTAVYTTQFELKNGNPNVKNGGVNLKNDDVTGNTWLELGKIANIAEVYVNGVNCGVAWTAPYRVNISKAIKPGNNKLEIEISNTWANRLIGDRKLPEDKRITRTSGVTHIKDQETLLPAGLLGPVKIVQLDY